MRETGGELTIASKKAEHGQLLVSVSDSGIGLPVDEAERIFDAFFTTKPQGTGMGLSISRRIPTPDGVRSYSSHCPASDSRLAVGSLTRWRQKSVVHKAASFRHAVGIVGCPPLKRLKARHDRPSASMRERPEPQLLLADRPKSRQTVRLDDQEEDDQRAEDHRLQIGYEID